MKRSKNFPFVLLCALLSFGLDFWYIPGCLARGTPDPVWMGLMLLLPALGAAVLARFFRPSSPRAPFLGLPLQWALALILSQPLGNLLGFRLGSFSQDLFDWIAYAIFILGWSAGAALVQFVTLFLLERRTRP